MRRIYKDCKVTQTNIVFSFYRGLSHLTGVRNIFFDSRNMSRITRNYEKYKNYKYLQVINMVACNDLRGSKDPSKNYENNKTNNFDKKSKKKC